MCRICLGQGRLPEAEKYMYNQLRLFCMCGCMYLTGPELQAQAWIVRNMVTIFAKVAKRPHTPRDAGIRRLFNASGIPIPQST